MILYQTYSTGLLNRYIDYVELIKNNDCKMVRIDDSQCSELYLEDFDYVITDFMQEHFINVPDGIYKFKNKEESSRYVYAHMCNNTIVNVLFDQNQAENIFSIYLLEDFKNRVFESTLFYKKINNSLETNRETELKREVYEDIDWSNAIDQGFDDEYLSFALETEEDYQEFYDSFQDKENHLEIEYY